MDGGGDFLLHLESAGTIRPPLSWQILISFFILFDNKTKNISTKQMGNGIFTMNNEWFSFDKLEQTRLGSKFVVFAHLFYPPQIYSDVYHAN